MAPIKFQTPDGYWVGVGDMVWAARDEWVRRGMVTGFDRSGEDVDSVELTISDSGIERPWIFWNNFDHTFGDERNAQRDHIKYLQAMRDQRSIEVMRLDQQINKLISIWGIDINLDELDKKENE